jgi:hypothetical protein
MKKLLIVLLTLGPFSAFSQTSGAVEIRNYDSIINTSFLTISGDAAKKIWNDMVYVNVSPADQYQPNDFKIRDGINCELVAATQEVSCHILLNSSEGIIKR